MAALNGKEFEGRALNVNEARPKTGGGDRGGRGGYGGGGDRGAGATDTKFRTAEETHSVPGSQVG